MKVVLKLARNIEGPFNGVVATLQVHVAHLSEEGMLCIDVCNSGSRWPILGAGGQASRFALGGGGGA